MERRLGNIVNKIKWRCGSKSEILKKQKFSLHHEHSSAGYGKTVNNKLIEINACIREITYVNYRNEIKWINEMIIAVMHAIKETEIKPQTKI